MATFNQVNIGNDPNNVPINAFLGKLAYTDSVPFKSIQINLGSKPLSSGSFTITDSGLTVNSQVLIQQGITVTTYQNGLTLFGDDIETDPIIAGGIVINPTTIKVSWWSPYKLSGIKTFNYIAG
jgi:hypothetical protein